jgi:hypothetical protein
MSKWSYIIIKVEHDAPNTEVVARECYWDIDHENIIDAKIVGYVEHDPEFDHEVLQQIFYSFESYNDGASSEVIDEEFDDATEEDFEMIQQFKEASNNDIRNSTNVHGS